MRTFDYHKPGALPDAMALLSAFPDSRPLAGGMTLLPTLKLRLATPSALVDLAGLPGLTGVSRSRDGLTIGAMTRHVDVARSAAVKAGIPALADLAASIGDPAVRNRGTIGGSLANNDPAADYPAAALGLGATIVTPTREIAADDFFLGLFETALEADELITAVHVPLATAAGYAKLRNPASRYAILGVFVARTLTGVRVAVTGAGSGVFRLAEFEAALTERFSADALAGLKVDAGSFASDIHAEAAYRAHLATVMAQRAVTNALESERGA